MMLEDKRYRLLCGDSHIGYFIINKGCPSVSLLPNLSLNQIPWDFRVCYTHGTRDFSGKIVDRWISDRVTPSGRHNINEILKSAGLSEYNPLGLFLYTNGRYTQDNFRIL